MLQHQNYILKNEKQKILHCRKSSNILIFKKKKSGEHTQIIIFNSDVNIPHKNCFVLKSIINMDGCKMEVNNSPLRFNNL